MHRSLGFFSVLTIAVAAMVAPLLQAHEYKAAKLTIDHPWVRASLGAVPNTAGYMTIINAGDAPDTLIAASSPAVERVELHEHVRDGEVLRMREVEGGIAIPAGGKVAFAPGGLHLMLMGVKEKLKAGTVVDVTLEFKKAGTVEIVAMVEKMAPRGSASDASYRGSAASGEAAAGKGNAGSKKNAGSSCCQGADGKAASDEAHRGSAATE